jgi:transposase-like protein
VFTNYQRSEKALIIAIREMVINGVSTPKVKKITGKLSEGLTYSKSTVSRMMKELDPMISEWRGRQLLDYYVYMISDATYFYVRENNKVVSIPLLLTIGIDKSGHRSILGADMAISESEESWREHHRKIKARGVDKVGLTISDAHQGLMTVLHEEYSGAPHQRCMVHFMRNLVSKVPPKEREILADYAKQIFSSGKLSMALKISEMISDEYRDKYPAVSGLLDEHIEESLAYYNFPRKHWKKIKTSNLIEGTLNTILKRRSKAVGIFPNRESCIRYACSLLMEISEDWETGRRYMIIEEQEDQENDKLLDEIKETKQAKELVAL